MPDCNYCHKESTDAYHAECWRSHQAEQSRVAAQLHYEALDAIERIGRGQDVHVSSDCMAQWGVWIAAARERARGGKGRSRKVDL